MRKLILFFVLIFLIIGFFPQKVTSNEQSYQVIPDEAIRLRILANSEDEKDQATKHAVRDAVNEEVTRWVEEMDDIDEARQLISSRIDDIDQIVKDTVAEEATEYTVEYRKDVKFPTKLYDNYLYPAGEYEAILITLGEAEGSNWWCVVFPPLCFLDFSFGTTVEAAEDEEDQEEEQEEKEKEEEEVEYTFFFLKWFN
ncbi:stage II sporulation protein R [Gracilibacillus salitolerans]|uniref:Stage II sporulation protein R n=1 Tax=Gracilibacillus salitolerans TaxID=2663022 RepID=A0A5Q2TN17_9BACI|nr:stage II sporulation protein R [Gracilibacillus salitolerans]QGH36354.1 stage II sporulation protein R [Gracilibacillus salitolerans]